jgi:hypothetical protein
MMGTPMPRPQPISSATAGHAAAHAQEARRFEAALDGGAHRVVDQRELDGVEEHAAAST